MSINWDPVFNCCNVNQGYNYFQSKIKECYVTTAVSSLLNSLAKDQRIRSGLHWGLKRCSQHKNRLFRKWMQTRSPLHEAKCKNTEAITRNYLMKQRSLIFLTFLMSKPILLKCSGRIWLQLPLLESRRIKTLKIKS